MYNIRCMKLRFLSWLVESSRL